MAMRCLSFALLAAAQAAVAKAIVVASAEPWEAWLEDFGHDAYRYPAWVSEQRRACTCEGAAAGARPVERAACKEGPRAVDWRQAEELTWCVARHFLLNHMPEFDLHYLPGAVSVDGASMLDDNIAFALMAWNASRLSPKPPLRVALSYFLPYASYHEARNNWRPLFFAKYFGAASKAATSLEALDALIGGGTPLMNWTRYSWPSFGGLAKGNAYNLGPFASGSTPPVLAPFDFLAYGYGSCTAWATFLASALKAVGVPARQVGAPCWNTAEFAGLATANPNVSLCWAGGSPAAPGGKNLNNHNWVEYWDNVAGTWHFLDIAQSSATQDTWFCGKYDEGCTCASNAGKAMQDHDIFAVTWSPPGEDAEVDGGEVLDVATSMRLTTGEAVSPLVWSPHLTSPLGEPLKDVGLRMVNRTAFYRCKGGGTVVDGPTIV